MLSPRSRVEYPRVDEEDNSVSNASNLSFTQPYLSKIHVSVTLPASIKPQCRELALSQSLNLFFF